MIEIEWSQVQVIKESSNVEGSPSVNAATESRKENCTFECSALAQLYNLLSRLDAAVRKRKSTPSGRGRHDARRFAFEGHQPSAMARATRS